MRLVLWALVAVAAAPTAAFADVTGSIEGIVSDQATHKKLAGVTITVTSPALQGEQTEFSDQDGHYIITELPPGEYLVRFYFSNITIERPGVFVTSDKTLAVNVAIPTQKAEVKTYHITEKAPTVDVGNTQTQTSISSEFVRNTPVQGRTYDAVMALAPGAAAGAGEEGQGKGQSYSFNGATGPENNFLIDGINTTNPAVGLMGTQLTLEFIGETELITGGYNAEYGRATGGVINLITKSGSNTFHGGVWFFDQPLQLDPRLVQRSGEAIGSKSKIKNNLDFGFDLGGPIVKDKIWFYAGFAPTFKTQETTRMIFTRTDNDIPSDPAAAMGYQGDVSSTVSCPGYLDKRLCTQPGYITEDAGSQYHTKIDTTSHLYNWIAKFNFQLNANNSLMLQYVGSPATVDGIQGVSTLNGSTGQMISSTLDNTHDALAHYISKLLDRRLQIDLLAGYHYEDKSTTLPMAGQAPNVVYQDTESLYALEGNSIAPCKPNATTGFDPCKVLDYAGGGFGFDQHTTVQRVEASVAATYFARLAGTHALKVGFEFEDEIYRDSRYYTGGGAYTVLDGQTLLAREFAQKVLANGPNGQARLYPQGFKPQSSTFDYAAYARDSWNVGFVPGLTINAGVRWEGQQLVGADNRESVGIWDNWAPRVGAIWDPTRKGRAKIFASYGRFYESIPLDINDRTFSAEGLLANYPVKCGYSGTGPLDTSKCVPPTNASNASVAGGNTTPIQPGLKGQFSEEVTAGVQWDVGWDMVLGASYIHRDLGRIIEDVSPDGGNTFIVANPGDGIDQGEVKKLQSQIDHLPNDPGSCGGGGGPGCPKGQAIANLAAYKNLGSGFPKPTRNYDALILTATKRLSNNFMLLASYTYSRTLGNYPGLFQASNGQLDPNISTQYDLRELLINRNGPLPNDRPHNFKLNGSYFLPFGQNTMVFGAAFNAYSGTPIDVLGSHATYGPLETYILPRGMGGRTPFVTQLDLHLSYRRQLSRVFGLEVSWDIFNVANEQAPIEVDSQYTTSSVRPIAYGTVADLKDLKTLSGNSPLINPNYGHAVVYQQPLSMRWGVRLSF